MSVYLYQRIWVFIHLLRYFLCAVPVCTWRPHYRKWCNQIQAVLCKGAQNSTPPSHHMPAEVKKIWFRSNVKDVFMSSLFIWGWLDVILNACIFDCICTDRDILLFWDVMCSILTATWHIPDSIWHKNFFPNINVPLGLYCMIRTISIMNCLESPIQREVTNPKQLWLSAHFQQTCSVCLNW